LTAAKAVTAYAAWCPAGRRYQSIAADAVLQVSQHSAANAGCIMLRADGGDSTQMCWLLDRTVIHILLDIFLDWQPGFTVYSIIHDSCRLLSYDLQYINVFIYLVHVILGSEAGGGFSREKTAASARPDTQQDLATVSWRDAESPRWRI